MDSSSESEFRYDGGEIEGGGFGTAFGITLLVAIILVAIIVLMALSFTGTLDRKWGMMLMPSSQIAHIVANYKLETAPTAAQGVCKMDATSKAFSCTAPTAEIDATTGAVKAAATENLSVIWKDKMLSSGSDSAWGKSMYRQEGMCGQC
jgi:hypothetical protein